MAEKSDRRIYNKHGSKLYGASRYRVKEFLQVLIDKRWNVSTTNFFHTNKFIDKDKGRKVEMRELPISYTISAS